MAAVEEVEVWKVCLPWLLTVCITEFKDPQQSRQKIHDKSISVRLTAENHKPIDTICMLWANVFLPWLLVA